MAETNPFMNLGEEEEVSSSDNPFMNLGEEVSSSDNPFMNLEEDKGILQRIDDATEGNVIREVAEGVLSGSIKGAEGLSQLAVLPFDIASGSTYSDRIAESSKKVREALDLNPEGFAGKGTEIVTQFVGPGIFGAKAAGKLGNYLRGGKEVSRTRRVAEEIVGSAVADAAVATDDVETLGDWFDNPVVSTTDLIGLSGKEKALARLSNKLKVGIEGGIFGAGIQGIISGTGKTVGELAKTPTFRGMAGRAKDGLDKLSINIDDLLSKRMLEDPNAPGGLTAGQKFLADSVGFILPRGYLPEAVATKRLKLDGSIDQQIKAADRNVTNLQDEMKIYVDNLPEASELRQVDYLNNVENYLVQENREKKAALLKAVPKPLRKSALRMRKHVDALSKNIMDSNFVRENDILLKNGVSVKDMIHQNLNSYLRRTYKIHTDKNYIPSQVDLDNAKDFMKKSKTNIEYELTKAFKEGRVDNEFLSRNNLSTVASDLGPKVKVTSEITDEAAEKSRDLFLLRNRIKSRSGSQGGKVARDKLNTKMFTSRTLESKELRSLLGEVKDPRQAYLGTVADLAQFSAIDDFYGTVSKLAETNSGIGKFFVKPKTKMQEIELKDRGFKQLGSEVDNAGREAEDIITRKDWGTLDGYFVPEKIYNNLTNTVLAQGNFGTEILRGAYSFFRRAKGISQYSKTVLSPVTQVRNFLTASMFMMANGNLFSTGTATSLGDSIRAVMSNVTNKGSDETFKLLEEAQRLGVIGSNAELREIQDLLSKNIGITGAMAETGVTSAGRQMLGSESLDRMIKKGGPVAEVLAKPFGAISKKAEALYQGSDDVWKLTSWVAEQDKLTSALKTTDSPIAIKYLKGSDDSLEVANLAKKAQETGDLSSLIKYRAGQIVADTVPNYNKGASEAVRWARNLPLGNFITFPAEMYRTSFNIVKQSLDDMASPIEAIQKRGSSRLMSFTATTAILPVALPTFAYLATGISKEEMNAYKRSFAPPWERGAVLIPVGKEEDGTINYINFSTSNPYDIVYRFANRALNEADTAIKDGKDPATVLLTLAHGAMAEGLQPFTDPSIITAALADIAIRDGRTNTGAQVYNQADSFGTKRKKEFLHVLESVLPGLVPMNVSSGNAEPSRFLRGVLGGTPLVNSKDKQGREYNFLTEIARQMSGVTPQEFDPKKALLWQAYKFGQLQSNAKQIFNSVANDYNADSKTFMDAFIESNQAKFNVDKQYARMFDDLRTIGMPEVEIRKVLKKNQIGGAKEVMRGKFKPAKVTPQNLKKMREVGTLDLFPRKQINEITQRLRNISLNPKEVKPDFSVPNVNTTPVPVPVVNPFMNLPDVNTTPSVNPFLNLSTQTNAPRPVDPALVGNDPATQAIANRLS